MNSSAPLVSVIVPMYNVEKYIKECLLSILEQTYSEIELIAIDDGSTDQTTEIVERLNKDYEFVFLKQENSGQSVARNRGVGISRGKYLMFVDSDDYIERETVEKTVSLLEEYDCDVVRFNGKSFIDSEYKKDRESVGDYDFSNVLKENTVYEGESLADQYRTFSPSPCLYIFKKELVIENEIEFPEDIIHEDELFSIKLFLNADRMMYVNEFFYNRRFRKGSVMTKVSPEQKRYSFTSYFTVVKEVEKMIEELQLNKQQRTFLLAQVNELYISMERINLDKQYKQDYLKQIKYKNYLYIQKKKMIYILRRVKKTIKNKD